MIDYAKVADRLNLFRSDNPRSKITTKSRMMDNGSLVFKAYIWKDKIDFYELLKAGVSGTDALESADSEGTVMADGSQVKAEKGFEKLETIAVGRALALLGYAGSGEVASSEEMEEFEKFKSNKAEEAKVVALESIKSAKNIKELLAVWRSFTKEQQLDKEIVASKNKRKVELSK